MVVDFSTYCIMRSLKQGWIQGDGGLRESGLPPPLFGGPPNFIKGKKRCTLARSCDVF